MRAMKLRATSRNSRLRCCGFPRSALVLLPAATQMVIIRSLATGQFARGEDDMAASDTPVTIPNDIILSSGGSKTPADLLPPLTSLLIGAGVLPDSADTTHTGMWWLQGTPSSAAILESGATALSKGWSVLLGALGGTTAITAGATDFWKSQLTGASRVVAVGGAGLIIVTTIIAIAYMVVGDIGGRTRGAVALYTARRDIVLRYLELADTASQSTGSSSGGGQQAQAGGAAHAQAAAPQAAAGTGGGQQPPPAGQPSQAGPTLSDMAFVALAAAYRKAGVNINGGGSGSITGIRHHNGRIEIGIDVGSGTPDWRAPAELELDPHLIN
jgi:hypothetical protein